MSRRPQKMISQALVVVLISFVALAILAYVNRPTKPTPGNDAQASAPTAAAKVDDKTAPGPDVMRTETPGASRAITLNNVGPNKPGASAPDRIAQHTPTNNSSPTDQPIANSTSGKKSWDDLLPLDKQSQPKLIALANVSNDPQIAQKQLESGGVLSARQSLNAMLLSGSLDESQMAETKRKIAELSNAIIFSTKRFADDPFGGTYAVQNGDALQKIAKAHGVTWELLGRMNDISDPRKLRAGRSIKIINGPFHAVVSKSRFEMEIWLGEPMSADAMYVATYRVGLGKEGSTPTGTWQVSAGGKMKNPKFWGAAELPLMEADDPQNPLGEFWLALTGVNGEAEGREGYGIHGTIDPTSIGKNASHGCIRLTKEDIAMVYELLVDAKSKVYVKD